MEWFQLFDSDTEALKTIADKKAVTVEAAGIRLCVARSGSSFYALKDACPHSGAPLSKGIVNNYAEVVCPLHHYRFRLLDGVESNEKSAAAITYPVELRKEGLFIQIG